MLSPEERKRLEGRDYEEMDSQIKASNDARARRKLAKWLKEDLNDVFLCLRQLPKNQQQRVFKDEHVYSLLTLVTEMMKAKGFRPIVGRDLEHPEEWKAERPEKWEAAARGEYILNPATNADIVRSKRLTSIMMELHELADVSSSNPVAQAEQFRLAQNNPAIQKVIKDNPAVLEKYKKALEWISNAEASIKEEESH